LTEDYGDSGSYDGGRSSERFLPPQDLEAERSVLGGMMLSKDAIADVVEAAARDAPATSERVRTPRAVD
jgi:replicative DNA helicase